MTNIVQFPSAGGAAARGSGTAGSGNPRSAHLGSSFFERPPAHAHAVQFYDDERFLLETVAAFLHAGLSAGDAALVIATRAHTDEILARLGAGVAEGAVARGDLLLIDAEAMLARFMHGDRLDEAQCLATLGRVLTRLSGCSHAGAGAGNAQPRRLRAFGEMVDLLWKRGNAPAALRLEALWGRAGSGHDLVLLCGYGMGDFYKADDVGLFSEVCRLHTHVMPTERFAREAEDVFERLREISLIEQRARSLAGEVAYREELEATLRAALMATSSRLIAPVAPIAGAALGAPSPGREALAPERGALSPGRSAQSPGRSAQSPGRSAQSRPGGASGPVESSVSSAELLGGLPRLAALLRSALVLGARWTRERAPSPGGVAPAASRWWRRSARVLAAARARLERGRGAR